MTTGGFYANPSLQTGPQACFISGPSLLHDNGTPFAFADGHMEYHKWLDRRTLGPNFQTHYTKRTLLSGVPTPDNLDVAWLLARTTANQDGTPAW